MVAIGDPGWRSNHSGEVFGMKKDIELSPWEYWKQAHDKVLNFLIFENIVIAIGTAIIILVLILK